MDISSKTIGFVGGGNMAYAIAMGMIKGMGLPPLLLTFIPLRL